MAKYCCPRCHSELTCFAVLTSINPAFIRCMRCGYQVRISLTRVSTILAFLTVVIIALVFTLFFFQVSAGVGGLALLCLGILSSCLYTAALNTGFIPSDLIPALGPAVAKELGAYGLDRLVPENWRVDSKIEEEGYKASSPDGNQVMFIKYSMHNALQTIDNWVDDSRCVLLSTRYCSALNNFTIMDEKVCRDDNRGYLILDGYDHDNGYRLVTQHTRYGSCAVCVSLHQFSCQSYSSACGDAAVSLPVAFST